ncbi:MAG: DUF2339 domain-containing protein [Phycisphaerae bacterium]
MLWFTTAWSWGFYALLLGDILIRAWKRSLQTREALDAALVCLATGAMFAGTHMLLNDRYHAWMGLYTGLLAAGIVVLVVALWRLAGRKALANTFLVLGLVLFALAVPIQFDHWEVTVAWTAQGAAAMVIARLLGNRILLLDSPVVLGLALVQFLFHELPRDALVGQTAFAAFGASVSYGLLMAAMLTAGFLVAPAALRLGKAILSEKDDQVLACCLVLTGVILLAVRTAIELPRVGATWWWLVSASVLAGVAIWRQSKWLAAIGTTFLALAAAKWVAWDTLASFLGAESDPRRWVALNWQFIAGAALAAALLLDERLLRRREMGTPRTVGLPLFLAASLLVAWGGSFEVHRYFHSPAAPSWVDAFQGTQMGLSIWWALNAAVLMALGFTFSKASLRWTALAIFAATIAKVLILDMEHIEKFYRVLSVLGLGVLLVVGTFLYHRRFRPKA